MFEGTDNFYELLTRDYINGARMEGFSFCAIVEALPDVDFWREVFWSKGKVPDLIHISQNKNGNATTGVMQCLKYRDYACKEFIICLDSDYRYLLKDTSICVNNFILQTYTYAMDNHYCHHDRLNDVCKASCNFENKIFDFKVFWEKYSETLYPLFVWHIYLMRNHRQGLSNDEFLDCINKSHEGVPFCDVKNNSQGIIDKLENLCNSKVGELSADNTNVDLDVLEADLHALGVTKQNVYLFARGHNIQYLLQKVGEEVVKEVLKMEKIKCNGDTNKIHALYQNKVSFSNRLIQQPLSFSYPEIIKLSDDISRI